MPLWFVKTLSVPKQRLVVPVVLAEELVDALVLRHQRERPVDAPGAGEDVGIFHDDLVLERAMARLLAGNIASAVSLGGIFS